MRKGVSTTAVSLNAATVETQHPHFSFGSGLPGRTPLFGVVENLASSPSPEKRPQSAHSPLPTLMGAPRIKQPISGLMGQLRSGSPAGGYIRKFSAPSQRPRKQFRRSLSMTATPSDIMNGDTASYCTGLDPIKDIDDTPQLQLPHFRSEDESVPRINKHTLVEILDGKYGHCYDRSVIIDCRFEYEYDGGHIAGAINFNNKEDLACNLFECDKTIETKKTLLILHCEYSAHRAPIM